MKRYGVMKRGRAMANTNAQTAPSGMAVETKKHKVLTIPFLLLILCYTMGCLTFQFLSALFVSYGVELGYERVAVAGAMSMTGLTGLIMKPIGSVIGDKFNKKKMFGTMLLCMGGIDFLISFQTTLTMFFVLQLCKGVVWSLLGLSGQLMVSELVDKEDLGTGMGFYQLGQMIANAFASMLAIALANRFSYPFAFRCGAIFGLIGCIVALNLPVKAEARNKEASIIKTITGLRLKNFFNTTIIPFMVMAAVFQMFQSACGSSFLTDYSKTELAVLNAGIFTTINNFMSWFTRPTYGKIADKFGVRYCFIPGLIGMSTTAFILSRATGLTGLIAAAVVYGLSFGGCIPVLQATVVRAVPPEQKASALSTSSIGYDLSLMATTTGVAYLCTMFGTYKAAYTVVSCIGVAGLIYIIAFFTYYNKKHPNNALHW